jgi:hypothetical protein
MERGEKESKALITILVALAVGVTIVLLGWFLRTAPAAQTRELLPRATSLSPLPREGSRATDLTTPSVRGAQDDVFVGVAEEFERLWENSSRLRLQLFALKPGPGSGTRWAELMQQVAQNLAAVPPSLRKEIVAELEKFVQQNRDKKPERSEAEEIWRRVTVRLWWTRLNRIWELVKTPLSWQGNTANQEAFRRYQALNIMHRDLSPLVPQARESLDAAENFWRTFARRRPLWRTWLR